MGMPDMEIKERIVKMRYGMEIGYGQELVRCRDCKHRPKLTEPPKRYGFSIEFPEWSKCPCQCEDGFYSWFPADDWFCANGERNDTL